MRVLVVEDELLLRRLASALLARAGCSVTNAANGGEALLHADASWELVLMDFQMPELSGPETTRLWRAAEHASGQTRAFIVGLTSAASDEERAVGLEAGMDDVIVRSPSNVVLEALLLQARARSSRARPKAQEPKASDEPYHQWRGDYDGFESLLLELARSFQTQLPARVAHIEERLDAGDAQGLHDAAHALCGKALALHLLPLGGALKAIEVAARLGDAQLCRRAAARLRTEAFRAQREVAALIAALEPPGER